MRIVNIEVKNFRLLHDDISINIEEDVTLIVGRNNSGKSSLADICIDLLEKKNVHLEFADFSIGCYPQFEKAYQFFKEYLTSVETKESDKEQLKKRENVENELPKIELNLLIKYNKGGVGELSDSLVALANFITDLDSARNDAYICIEYSIDDAIDMFNAFEKHIKEIKCGLLEYLYNNIKKHYSIKRYSVDFNNKKYKRPIETPFLIDKVFLTRSIVAQRILDDNSADRRKALAKGFGKYYSHSNKNNDDIKQIEKSLSKISGELEEKYNTLFKKIIEDLDIFGAETPVKMPPIVIKSIFNPENVLSNNIRYFYGNEDGILLPENYNGLGYSNLVFMLLQFSAFFVEFKNQNPTPEFLLLFIEEPEAHMHPQMQQVFIRNVSQFIKENGGQAQIILTTHSSHIVAESGIDEKKGFDRIRYFDNTVNPLKVRDLSKLQITGDREGTLKFLKQYLTLQKCDLFFADKIILVEGATERLLLPLMIGKVSKTLLSQYISIVEVGGAYAHNFKDLLDFINVKTLIITDIDSIDPSQKRTACAVNESGAKTSNQTLISLLPKKELISELLAVKGEDKCDAAKILRVAFQVPEDVESSCGRSFEEAFILKNAGTLSKNAKLMASKDFFSNIEEAAIKSGSYSVTDKLLKILKKTDFAFDIMQLETWEVPCYIREGLEWLEKDKEVGTKQIQTT